MVKGYTRANWYPKAGAFIICTGDTTFEDEAGSSLLDLTGVSLWSPSIPVEDAFVGWSPLEFANEYEGQNGVPPTYQAAAAGEHGSKDPQTFHPTSTLTQLSPPQRAP